MNYDRWMIIDTHLIYSTLFRKIIPLFAFTTPPSTSALSSFLSLSMFPNKGSSMGEVGGAPPGVGVEPDPGAARE